MKREDFLQICRSRAKKELTPEEENFFNSIGEGIETAMQRETVERGKQLKEIADKLGLVDEGQTLSSVVRSLSQKIDEVEAKSKKQLSANDKFLLRKALESKKDDIYAVIRKESTTPWALEFKAKRAASAMMTTANVLTGAAAFNHDNIFDDVDITVIRYPQNFIGDVIGSRQVAKVPAVIQWKEQVAGGDGLPAVVAEGDAKPLTSDAFVWKYSYRKKYAGRIELTEEVEIDFEQLVLDIITMFEEKVLREYNKGLLTDILAWAPAYAGTALDDMIVKPTLQNVVNAGKLQLALNEYAPDTLIVNPADYAEVQNMQDTLGNPIFVADSVLFPGIRVIVTAGITAGTCLLLEGGIIKEQHGSFILRSGTYGNQLIENERTIIGELFSNMKLPTESKKGVVKLVIATVKAALLKP